MKQNIELYDTVIYKRNGVVICPKSGHLVPVVNGSMGMVTQINITAYGWFYQITVGELLINMVSDDDIQLAPERKKDHICNMVTYFNRKDLVSFGDYLLSEKRKAKIIHRQRMLEKELEKEDKFLDFLPDEELVKNVYHADVENWLEEQKKNE